MNDGIGMKNAETERINALHTKGRTGEMVAKIECAKITDEKQ
jgi:hypothetical protein